jgi:hypothetical protein
MTRQEELTRQGLKRQATYDEPRLSEMADMYEEIGLKVHLEPFHPDDEPGCKHAGALQNHLYAQKACLASSLPIW